MLGVGANMYGNPEASIFTDVGQASLASSMSWASIGLGAAGLGLSIVSGALNASANRQKARAEMSALRQSWQHNLGVMRQNKIDTYASNIMSAYASGVRNTGSTAAVILGNQNVLENEIQFQEQQYQTQMKNLRAQSKQKYLGIF